jgi:hypothetical protein
MKKKYSIKIAFLISFIWTVASCTTKTDFIVEGIVKDGAGKMLYLENITTSSIVGVDSIKLKNDGSFKFKHKKPETPDFYRLRLNNRFINLTVDSTETITIQSDTLGFALNYTIEGSSESEKIKNLTFLQLHASEAYNKLQKQYNAKTISADEYYIQMNAVINEYKKTALEAIYAFPASASAYFALFQQINGLLLFDPYDKTDSRAYGAVANNWNQNYPEAPRTKHLIAIYADGLKTIRGEKAIDYQASEVDSKEYFDISLLSVHDNEIRLSDVGQGKVVLLDFTAYELKNSPDHNIQLNRIYEKYRSQGFIIYQVSLDTDAHFWKNAANNLPWFCVIDPQSIYSEIVKKYNVSNLPAAFILSRTGEIVQRIDNYEGLENEIGKFLK